MNIAPNPVEQVPIDLLQLENRVCYLQFYILRQTSKMILFPIFSDNIGQNVKTNLKMLLVILKGKAKQQQ